MANIQVAIEAIRAKNTPELQPQVNRLAELVSTANIQIENANNAFVAARRR
jgi:hypothetical protein